MTSPSTRFSGYATFSEFIASDPELSVYRSFKTLASRNLLHLQSSLLAVEQELAELDANDAQQMDTDTLLSAKCWETFHTRAREYPTEYPREAERIELITRVKTATKEYYEALLLHSEVMKLSRPSNRVYRVFKGWFESEQPFVGYGSSLAQDHDDLVALSPSADKDFLTRSLQDLAGRYMPGSRHSTSEEVKYYSTRYVSRLVTVITVLAASLVIEGAIVTLYIVKEEHIRLGLIALFTSLFAAGLALTTDGRRTDIILATAACAAVLVVFVSQN